MNRKKSKLEKLMKISKQPLVQKKTTSNVAANSTYNSIETNAGQNKCQGEDYDLKLMHRESKSKQYRFINRF